MYARKFITVSVSAYKISNFRLFASQFLSVNNEEFCFICYNLKFVLRVNCCCWILTAIEFLLTRKQTFIYTLCNSPLWASDCQQLLVSRPNLRRKR